jgi:hypothetical protein
MTGCRLYQGSYEVIGIAYIEASAESAYGLRDLQVFLGVMGTDLMSLDFD